MPAACGAPDIRPARAGDACGATPTPAGIRGMRRTADWLVALMGTLW